MFSLLTSPQARSQQDIVSLSCFLPATELSRNGFSPARQKKQDPKPFAY